MSTTHTITYERSKEHDWLWRATCPSCCWATAGERERVVERAADHVNETEWFKADPNAPEYKSELA